ncbi:hypothetical protein NP233_g4300 [Leucocoprinus birnbaumii]|uniref:NACHT domain-containing protein n=1 Tax=Leucocoprinus birnbaumii TaxID=56174 RepID=A0AAD5VUX8_9AGAR|nr:hypothetical protein NP233_g4300 [Leucocoprinus birnbaumii]
MPSPLFSSSSSSNSGRSKNSLKIKLTVTKLFGKKSSSKNVTTATSRLIESSSSTAVAAQSPALVSSQGISQAETKDVAESQISDDDSDLSSAQEEVEEYVMEAMTGDGPQASELSGSLAQDGSTHLFHGAHDMVLNQPNFTAVHGQSVHNDVGTVVKKQVNRTFIAKFKKTVHKGGTALLILNETRVRNAHLHTIARDPPPRCHEGTRTELREYLRKWLEDATHRSTLLIWLTGPAGAGKTAVAQTFAESCLEVGRLGAVYFFSSLNQRAGHEGVISTIAYQLARKHPGYMNQITEILSEDPSIPESVLETQFRKLIAEPFAKLPPMKEPLVIVIDGLDECKSKRAQRDLIWLIGKYATSDRNASPSLMFLVCSRTEPHIRAAFSRASPRIGYSVEELMSPHWYMKETSGALESKVDYNRQDITCNAQSDIDDVYLILRDGLQKLHNLINNSRDGSKKWPAETQLQELSRSVGGLPVFASTVIRFIGHGRDPEQQLRTCLLYLRDLKLRTSKNPLEGLDTLYKHIMDRVSVEGVFEDLANAKLILSLLVILSDEGQWLEKINTALDVRLFLGLSETSFQDALQGLHSVLDIPADEDCDKLPIQFFHKSFGEFLRDPARSGKHTLDMIESRFEVARHAIRIYKEICQSNCCLKEDCSLPCNKSLGLVLDGDVESDMDWYTEYKLFPHAQLRRFVRANFWDMLCVESTKRNDLLELLREFDFCHLPFVPAICSVNEAKCLPRFMDWITNAIDSPEVNAILRVEPASEFDDILIKHCLSNPPLRKRFPKRIGEKNRYRYSFISTHRPEAKDRTVPSTTKMAFWIGVGQRAVLGLIDGPEDKEDDEQNA